MLIHKVARGYRKVGDYCVPLDTLLVCTVCHRRYYRADGEEYNFCPCCGTKAVEVTKVTEVTELGNQSNDHV